MTLTTYEAYNVDRAVYDVRWIRGPVSLGADSVVLRIVPLTTTSNTYSSVPRTNILVPISGLPGWAPAPRAERVDPIEAIFREIDATLIEGRDDDEPQPTQYALKQCKVILRKTSHLRPVSIPTPNIIALDGSLRLTWKTKTKNVRLVCPAYSRPYIYHETVLGSRAINWGTQKASPAALSKRLSWLTARFSKSIHSHGLRRSSRFTRDL